MEPEPLPYGDKKALVEEARKLGRFTRYEDLVSPDWRIRHRLLYTAEAPGSAYKAAAIAALEAVLELHKPVVKWKWSDGSVDYKCSDCWDGADYCPEQVEWPCETVTMIAEALGVDLSA